MSIAKGSKSKLIYAAEATLNVLPTAVAYAGLLFSQEGLVEQIDTFRSQDIRADRTVSAIRGGNFANGGSVTADLGLQRHLLFFKHLLAATVAVTHLASDGSGDVMIAILSAATFTRGTFIKSGTHIYVCEIGGVVTSGDVTAGLTVTSGTQTLTNTRWAFVCADATGILVYCYTMNGGIDFPATGLAFEKQLLGGSSNLFVALTGGRIDSVDLTIPQKGIVQSAWNLLFRDSTSGSATLASPSGVTYPTDDPVAGFDAFINLNNNAVVRPLQQGSLNIGNSIASDVYVIGSRSRLDLPEGERAISGKITTYFQDATEYNFFKGETVVPVEISFSHGKEYMSIAMGECKLTGSGTPQISGAGVCTASYDITAFKQSGTNDITVKMFSTVAALIA